MKKTELMAEFKLRNDFEQLFKKTGQNDNQQLQKLDVNAFLSEFKSSLNTSEVQADQTLQDEIVTDYRTDLITTAFDRAAVSGSVSPKDLLPDTVKEEDQMFILSALKSNFTIYSSGDKMPWRLNQNKRTEVLTELTSNRELRTTLGSQLPPTDNFGILLRQILTEGNQIDYRSLGNEELLELSAVLESLKDIDILKPDIQLITALLKKRALFSDYHLLSEHFVGREWEINRLLTFINDLISSYEWRGLLMTGMGGAGKSAIIAKLSDMLLNNEQASILIIDFDRPGVNPLDTIWMEEEVSRQLSDQLPDIAGQQRELRRSLRQYRQNDPHYKAQSNEHSNEQYSRSSKEILYRLASDLRNSPAGNKPLVMFFDTIEEILQKEQLNRLYRWLDDFNEAFYNFNLKIIFSGRVFGTNFPRHPNLELTDLEISEFDEVIAEAFLQHQGLNKRTSRDIARTKSFPLRPLELKLIAKLLIREKITFKKLLSQLSKKANGEITRDLFVGIVYRRVLLRIEDKIIQDFAYPGLIMRYINEDIILNVLAPVLHPDITTHTQAREIVDKLANYTWLAHRDEQGDIWHSLDLRRSMLALVTEDVAEKVNEIRDRAINYFLNRRSNKDQAEATYHKLFFYKLPEEGDHFEVEELQNAAGLLGNSLGELPKNAQVLLNFGQSEKIELHELNLLPDKFFKLRFDETCRMLVDQGLLPQALKIYKRAKKIGAMDDELGGFPMRSWEKELLFLTAHWDQLQDSNGYISHGSSLVKMLDYILPAALVNMDQVREMELEDVFTGSVSSNLIPDWQEPGNTDIIAQIITGLVLVKDRYPLKLTSKIFLPRLYTIFSERRDVGFFGRELNMLSCLAKGEPSQKYQVNLSNIKLDRFWLIRLRDLLPIANKQTVTDIIDQLDSYSTINSLLSFIDANKETRSNFQSATIDFKDLYGEDIYRLTVGPNPIFRTPCRYALYDAMKSSKMYDEIGVVIRELLPFKLVETSSIQFNNIIHRDTLEALRLFIEILDRSWLLGEFMDRVIPLLRNTQRLQAVSQAYKKWEHAYGKLLRETQYNAK